MTAQRILKMIESVDPNDTLALNEIEARVEAYLSGFEFLGMSSTGYPLRNTPTATGVRFTALPYTKSRDALKAIRPEGWHIRESGPWVSTRQFYCQMWKESNGTPQVYTEACATEELAELHAIISAIEWERSQ